MQAWLEQEGFEVKVFVDDAKKVTARDIYDAIDNLVGRGTLDQLVVYFAGHGCVIGFTELWLLSDAPDNPNEAVSLYESEHLANQSGIPNVVFISDACRSRADSLRTERTRGQIIFPNTGRRRSVDTAVDRFLATELGHVAIEAVKDTAPEFAGIFTTCFLDAFKRPDPEMVETVAGVRVVPNHKLKPYLKREVPKQTEAKSIRIRQIPEAYVQSDAFIGRAGKPVPPLLGLGPSTPVTVADVASHELSRRGATLLDKRELDTSFTFGKGGESIFSVARNTGFTAIQNSIEEAQGPSHFETQTGFAVYGRELAEAIPSKGIRTQILTREPGVGKPRLVRVDPTAVPGSVALQFTDGTGTVIAALPGYIGTVLVDGQGVSSIAYVPSRNTSRWEARKQDLGELRAAAAAAARFNVFRIEGDRDVRAKRAEELTAKIRNGFDPSLALYAAYAYADANLIEQLRSLHLLTRNDLKRDLFDIAMVSGALSGTRADYVSGPVPFCPMLSRGWALLRAKDVRLLPEVEAARDHLRPALWTTFDSNGMSIVRKVLLSGMAQ